MSLVDRPTTTVVNPHWSGTKHKAVVASGEVQSLGKLEN